MEPILPGPTPESSPAASEHDPESTTAVNAENSANVQPERSRETPRSPQATSPAPSMPVPVQPVSNDAAISQQPTRDDTSTSPAIADDADVIEKEWVDKAKKIVSATREDPHSQEKEVSKLQAEYLMKRYGKQIKLAE